MDADTLRDLFRDFGAIDIRRMFGGQGIFVDGMMFALVASDVIYLKADEQTVGTFEAEGLKPFSYATKTGEHTLTSYWQMPDRLYDDTDELARWARDAFAVARRKAAAKVKPAARKRPAAKAAAKTPKKKSKKKR